MGRWGRGELISKKADGSGDMYIVPRLHSTYSMSSLTGLTKIASFPKAAVASTWEYTKQLSMQNLCHTPTLTGGTTSTYYADGFHNDNAVSGLRVPARGGNADNGGNAGFEYLNVNNGVSTSNANYGSPLNFDVWFVVSYHTYKIEKGLARRRKIN